jgi:transposase
MADLRKRVCSMLGQNNNLKNSNIVKNFLQKGLKRRTIYDTIKRYEIGLPVEDLPRRGRPTSFNAKNLKRFKKCCCKSCWC